MQKATSTGSKPILFSGLMVRALIVGGKTQTRRVIKPQPPKEITKIVETPYGWMTYIKDKYGQENELLCPYGESGDELWVRETWRQLPGWSKRDKTKEFAYRADGDWPDTTWRPSIFMPREACRLRLLIEKVRVERLQDISHVDIFAEGAIHALSHMGDEEYADAHDRAAMRAEQLGKEYPVGVWANLWDSINKERGFGWDVNPWVWVIEFKRVS